MVQIEDGGIDVLLDGADLTLSQAFVTVWRGEGEAKRMLSPELRSAADERGFLVPGKEFVGGPETFPNVYTFTDGTSDLHGTLVVKAGDAAQLDKATGDDGEKYAHNGKKVSGEVLTRGVGMTGVMAKLGMFGAFAAGAGRAGAVNDEGIANVGFRVGDIEEKPLAECEDNPVRMCVTEAVGVVKVIGRGPFTLAFSENERGTINVNRVGRGVEVPKMTKEDRDGYREGALMVRGEDEGRSALFVKIIIGIGGGFAGDTITRLKNGVLGDEIPREVGIIAAPTKITNLCREFGRKSARDAAGDVGSKGILAKIEGDSFVTDDVEVRTIIKIDDVIM